MKNYLLYLLTLVATISYGQTTVNGVVNDENGTPIDYANVLLLRAADSTLYKGAISENGGKYAFDQVEAGDYFVEFSMIGLGDAKSEMFTITDGDNFTVPTASLSNGIEIEEVVVVARKPFIELKADKMVVNVENSAVNAGNSALEVLEKSPGVSIDNNNNISLRGQQGVLVMINGKNQYMSGEEISRFLESMPSSNIKSIEIITNPSAKYDAEGNSGIINIVLKKNEKLGTNGSIGATLRQGKEFSQFYNLGLNNRSEKVNLYGKVNYYNATGLQNLNLNRNIEYLDASTIFDQKSEMRETDTGYNVRAGADWDISSKTTIGAMVRHNDDDEVGKNINTTNISGDRKPLFDVLFVDTDQSEDQLSTTANVYVKHAFNDDGLQLTLDADRSWYGNDEMFDYSNFYRDNDGNDVANPYYLRNMQSTAIDIFATTADLSIPVSEKLNLETGVKFSSVTTDNNTLFEAKDETGNWVNQVRRSNLFNYDEDVYAAYVNGSGTIGQIMVQGGLRLEHTASRGISKTTGDDIARTYTNLFPSISLSKQLGQRNSVSVSYSRRLERPNYRDLNPFEAYLDEYTFQKGNPFLNPQYTDAYGLNFSLGRMLFVGLNYSHTTDAMMEVLEQDSEKNQTFQTNRNFDNTNNYSLAISMPKVWTDWWTSRVNYVGFYNDFKTPLDNGTYLDTGSFGHQINLNNEISIGRNINMELNGRLRSKMTYGQITLEPEGAIDFGLSTKLFDDRATLRLNVSDILYTNNAPAYIDQGGVNIYVDQTRDSRRVSLGLSYNFGNQKVKGARNRTTSSSEANDRI